MFDPTEILRVLRSHRVAYVLIGGMAAALHGSDVVTFDLDVTPRTDRENLEALAAALIELRAALRVEGAPAGVAFEPHADLLARVEVLTCTTVAGDLDIVISPSGSSGYADLSRDAVDLTIDGIAISVASLADVIRSKEASNREKDRAVLPGLKRLQARAVETPPA